MHNMMAADCHLKHASILLYCCNISWHYTEMPYPPFTIAFNITCIFIGILTRINKAMTLINCFMKITSPAISLFCLILNC